MQALNISQRAKYNNDKTKQYEHNIKLNINEKFLNVSVAPKSI